MAALPALAAALLMSSCGSEDEDAAGADDKATTEAGAPLRVEAAEGPRGTELIVYVERGSANVPGTAGGKRQVQLRCFDEGRRLIVSKSHPWPFTDTDNGLVPAHVHQRVPRTEATQVTRCELGGTRGPLSGVVTGTRFE